ncbi:MAG TPA: S8 family serine peptidase [Intrasporangiaceae bacterium]|nr:S8 family serine peptidase [Intrasporangiaceae bacterium]
MHKRAIAMVAAGGTAVALLGAAVVPANAAPKAGAKKPYVVIMGEMPVLAYEGGVKGIPATKPAKGKKINPKANNVKKYVQHLKKEQAEALADAGIKAKSVNQVAYTTSGFAVQLTDAEADRLRLNKNVAIVMEDVLKQKQTDVSPQFLGLSSGGEAWAKGATGKGVIVGVIDTGIWPEHPSFADNGKLPKPTGPAADVPCEFGDTAHNPDDKPFTCQNKLIGARDMRTTYKLLQGPEVYNSARDYDGHGTHVASTAAGNRNVKAEIFGIDRGMVSGVAPDAGVIAYSGLGALGGYGSDLAAAIDQAVADGVDVINYSIGSSSPALGMDDISFLLAAHAGVYVATSNGNSGPRPATIGSPAVVPWLTSVGASTHNRTFENTITLGNGKTYVGTSLTEGVETKPFVDAADHGNELCEKEKPFNPSIEGAIVLCKRGVNARVDKSEAVMNGGGAGMILYNLDDASALITDSHWLPSSHVRLTPGLEMKAYIASAGASATASMTQGEKAKTQANVMADFSSRGPNRAPASLDLIKPDVTAPGVNILAGNTPTPSSGRPGQLFQSISGTSMSSPQVAGLFALIKQVHPDWSPAIAKSALMTTARQNVVKEDGMTPADPFDFGAGHVNPGKTMKKGSMFDPGLAYDADTFDYIAFLCGNAPDWASLFGLCPTLEDAGYSFDATQLNLPSIGMSSVAGSHTVERTITNVSNKRLKPKVSVQAPAGYTVTVSPSRLDIAPGKSATFSITVSNKTAPVGEWRFGSLTWSDSGYKARSPIAVAATSLNAPAEVSNTGASGTGSVDVVFGYNGAYSVDTYGLADQVNTAGSVLQDPDASFDPGDVGNGATRHDFTLASGTKLFRIDLRDSDLNRPGEDVDLDLYLFSLTSGRLVAQSGAGGTDERIELTDPAGSYALFVHGWGVGEEGASVDYTLRSWTVGEPANGGTLQVTSAPDTATAGQTGTVEYSWSDVAAGTTELGLLLHKDGEGEIGRTVVAVSAP